MTHPDAKTIYQAVSAIGLTRAQVRRLLPDWWDPALEKERGGAAELAMHVSRRLSVELLPLLSGQIVPKGAMASVAYKHSVNIEASSLSAASFIASSLAQAVLAALPIPYVPLPQDPGDLRALAMRDRTGQFGFSALLELCWAHGIPVIPLPHLPVGVRKMDGAALQLGGRPAIVIAKKKSSRAWLSFILAHEIGHIALGHLRPGSSIIDVSLQETSTYATELSTDGQEAEADGFALQTLGGDEVTAHVTEWPVLAAPVDIAVLARGAAGAVGIEAGHFVLRYAFLTKRWPTALTALNFLSEDLDPEGALLQQLRSHLDLSRVADDLQDLVSQITGWDGAN